MGFVGRSRNSAPPYGWNPMNPTRLIPTRPFPPYAFLPGRDPHPTRDPKGHSAGTDNKPDGTDTKPSLPSNWATNGEYLYGIDLYNHGYLWEAHEAWEGLWHPAKSDPIMADFLQGLIQCAAAALKVRMGQPKGVVALAGMGTERLERVSRLNQGVYGGLDLEAFVPAFRAFAASEPKDENARPMIELESL